MKDLKILQDHLTANPKKEKVFFNQADQWAFHKTDVFSKERSREEILTMEDIDAVKVDTIAPVKKTAAQLIDFINAAETTEAATAAAEGDERATVKKALADKLLTFEKK